MTQVEISGARLKISRLRPDPVAFRGAKHTWLLTCPRCATQMLRSKQHTLCAGFEDALQEAQRHIRVHTIELALGLIFISFDLFEDKPALRSLISWHFERGLISLTTCQALMRWT